MDRFSLRDALLLIQVRQACQNGEAERIRKAHGLSQDHMALLAGVQRPTVTRWESGDRLPTGESGLRYAKALSALGLELKELVS